jgi:tape measure domain-containing protein
MSDVDFKIGATSKDADAAFDRVANKAMTTGQKIQSSMREASYNMASSMRAAVDKIDAQFGRFSGLIDAIKSKLFMITAILSAGFGANKILNIASDFELLDIRLKKIMGSAEEGQRAFAWIKQLGEQTPFSVKEVTDAFMMLKNFGLDPMDGTLRQIIDASSMFGKDMQAITSISLALGQAWGLGKLQGQDMMQMVNAGLPVWDLLSKATGKTIPELRQMSEAGQLGRDVMRQLIDEMGRVSEGAAKEKMDAYAGAVSNMGDAFDSAINSMREAGGFDWITKSIQGFTATIQPTTALFIELGGAVGDVLGAMWDVVSFVFSQIGMAIRTVFGQGGQAMTAFNIFEGVLITAQVTLISFRNGLEVIIATIKFLFLEMAENLLLAGNVIKKALMLDFDGAQAAWDTGTAKMKQIANDYYEDLVRMSKDAANKINNVLLKTSSEQVQDNERKDPDSATQGKGSTVPSRVGDWDLELSIMRDAFAKQKLEQGSFEEFSKAQERDYWKNILDTVKLSTEERRTVSSKYYALERELRKSAFDAEIADMKNALAAENTGGMERVKIAEDIAKKVGEKYGIESKEYKNALDQIRQMALAHQKQMEQLAQLSIDRHQAQQKSLLDLERVQIEERAAMGEISEVQKLQMLAQLKEQEFQLELQAATERAAFLEGDVVAYQQAMDKILAIKQKHEVAKAEIDKSINVAVKEQYDAIFAPINTAFDRSINGMIQGTQTLRGAMRNMGLAIVSEYASMGVRLVTQWLANQARMTFATAAGTTARTGIEAAGAAQSMAIGGAVSFKSIMNSAYEAMAAAYKAIAGIPFVGPVLAPVAAGVAFAGVAAIAGNVMSARGGYDIPAGVNPMTQLHEQEMVLPKEHAQTIRALGESGASGSAPVHIYGSDDSKIKIGDLKKALKQMNRNFVHTNQK